MTAKEKADELYSKYDDLLNKDFGNSIVFDNQLKQCALITVDEMFEEISKWAGGEFQEWEKERWKYLQEVKQEISNI